HHRHQQGVGIDRLQLGFRLRDVFFQAREELFGLGFGEGARHRFTVAGTTGPRKTSPVMPAPGDILLDQVLRPSPPLAPKILLRILVGVAFINLGLVAYFLFKGAWPIAPFMGLDVVLLGWAFRASTIAARREEHIVLTPSELSVERRFPKKPLRAWTFNPY